LALLYCSLCLHIILAQAASFVLSSWGLVAWLWTFISPVLNHLVWKRATASVHVCLRAQLYPPSFLAAPVLVLASQTAASLRNSTADLVHTISCLQDEMMPRYAELIYNGMWFTPEREALQALIDKTQEFVTGE
jgi:hypothetical protein